MHKTPKEQHDAERCIKQVKDYKVKITTYICTYKFTIMVSVMKNFRELGRDIRCVFPKEVGSSI